MSIGTVSGETESAARRFQSSRRWSLMLLSGIVVVSAVVLVAVWLSRPAGNTLSYELAKTALQVIALVGLGSLATLATFSFQHSREQETAERDDHARQRRSRIESARDTRARQDDFLRALLQETLMAYNGVKRLRRLLRAETEHGGHRRIDIKTYDAHMSGLIDQQLQFEQLKRRAPFIADDRLRPSPPAGSSVATNCETIETSYEKIEDYLNKVISEYEKKRYVVAAEPDGVVLTELPRLSSFVGGDFTVVSKQIHILIGALQAAVLQGSDQPDGLAVTGRARPARPPAPGPGRPGAGG